MPTMHPLSRTVALYRKGFTLVEMLVATMVFMTGFVAVYSLFIAGVNYRHDADQLTDLSLASTSLISTFRLTMRDQWNQAQDFVGDGDPANGGETEGDFYAYPDNPGVYFRIDSAVAITGVSGDGSQDSAGIRLMIYLIYTGNTIAPEMTFSEISKRQAVHWEDNEDYLSKYSNSFSDNKLKDLYDALSGEEQSRFILVRRNVLHKSEAIILRR